PDGALLQKAFGGMYPFLGRLPPFQPVPVTPPPPAGEGLVRNLDLGKFAGQAREVNINTDVANIEGLPQTKTSDIIKYAGLSVPTLRDLAGMEMQKDRVSQNQD